MNTIHYNAVQCLLIFKPNNHHMFDKLGNINPNKTPKSNKSNTRKPAQL